MDNGCGRAKGTMGEFGSCVMVVFVQLLYLTHILVTRGHAITTKCESVATILGRRFGNY